VATKKRKLPPAFVLMNRRTAELFEGYRVLLYDKNREERDLPSLPGWRITLMPDDFDGWLLVHPKLETAIFLNRTCERFFKNLGQL